MNWKHGSITATVAMAAAIPAVAQAPVKSERVQFARGASAATVRGSIRGYDSIDYIVGARAGQSMSVSLKASNNSAYFNVLPPRSQSAVFIGSEKGDRFDGRLRDSGDYRVRVYLMRNAARRGERATYSLTVSVNGRPGGGPGVGPGGPGGGPVRPGPVGPGPIGSGSPISPGNMPAFCRGEASAQYGVRPTYITTQRPIGNATGTMIDGSADQGRNGIKRFRCRFDSRGRFVDVMAMTRDGF